MEKSIEGLRNHAVNLLRDCIEEDNLHRLQRCSNGGQTRQVKLADLIPILKDKIKKDVVNACITFEDIQSRNISEHPLSLLNNFYIKLKHSSINAMFDTEQIKSLKENLLRKTNLQNENLAAHLLQVVDENAQRVIDDATEHFTGEISKQFERTLEVVNHRFITERFHRVTDTVNVSRLRQPSFFALRQLWYKRLLQLADEEAHTSRAQDTDDFLKF